MPTKSIKSSTKPTSRSECRIPNPQGLHTRAAAEFVKISQKFPGKIEVKKGELRADGKSILSLLQLEAKQGEMVQIEAKGKGAGQMIEELARLIAKGFYESS